MGSKHSPPRWWLQGELEEAMARDDRDAEYKRRRRETLFLGKEYDLNATSFKIPNLSMGLRARWDLDETTCGVCGTKTCMHMYEQHPPPLTEQEKIDQDVYILGRGYGIIGDDGKIIHIPAAKVLVFSNDKRGPHRG